MVKPKQIYLAKVRGPGQPAKFQCEGKSKTHRNSYCKRAYPDDRDLGLLDSSVHECRSALPEPGYDVRSQPKVLSSCRKTKSGTRSKGGVQWSLV